MSKSITESAFSSPLSIEAVPESHPILTLLPLELGCEILKRLDERDIRELFGVDRGHYNVALLWTVMRIETIIKRLYENVVEIQVCATVLPANAPIDGNRPPNLLLDHTDFAESFDSVVERYDPKIFLNEILHSEILAAPEAGGVDAAIVRLILKKMDTKPLEKLDVDQALSGGISLQVLYALWEHGRAFGLIGQYKNFTKWNEEEMLTKALTSHLKSSHKSTGNFFSLLSERVDRPLFTKACENAMARCLNKRELQLNQALLTSWVDYMIQENRHFSSNFTYKMVLGKKIFPELLDRIGAHYRHNAPTKMQYDFWLAWPTQNFEGLTLLITKNFRTERIPHIVPYLAWLGQYAATIDCEAYLEKMNRVISLHMQENIAGETLLPLIVAVGALLEAGDEDALNFCKEWVKAGMLAGYSLKTLQAICRALHQDEEWLASRSNDIFLLISDRVNVDVLLYFIGHGTALNGDEASCMHDFDYSEDEIALVLTAIQLR